MDKCELIQNTLGLDYIVSNLSNDCETEITLKIKKENNKYGILSFEYKEEKSESISKIKVYDSNNNLIDIYKTNGTVKDYEEMCLSIKGVGHVKIYPQKDENLNYANGHITCVITNDKNEKVSEELRLRVQKYVSKNSPMGAIVHVIS